MGRHPDVYYHMHNDQSTCCASPQALGPADGEGSFQCPFTIPSGKCYHGHRVSHGSPEAAAQTPETVPVCSGPRWVCRAEKSPCCGEQSLKDPPSCSGLPEHTAWHGEVTTPAPWAMIPSLLGTPICPASESGTWGCVGRWLGLGCYETELGKYWVECSVKISHFYHHGI